MTTKSRKMALVVLIGCLLPALTAAKIAFFTACGDGVDFSDPLLLTQEGINIFNKLANMKLIMWEPDDGDRATTCHSLSVVNKLFTITYKKGGATATASGTMEIVHNNGENNYIDINTAKGVKLPTNNFGSGDDGKIRMYVQYLSDSEMTFMTCRDAGWWASDFQFYVFSTVDYSHLRTRCMLDTANELAGFNTEFPSACV